jgi:hypothetical protein
VYKKKKLQGKGHVDIFFVFCFYFCAFGFFVFYEKNAKGFFKSFAIRVNGKEQPSFFGYGWGVF